MAGEVLIISERYWPEGSGGELATQLVSDILRKEFTVTVITGSKNPFRLSGVKYIYNVLETQVDKLEKVYYGL